MARVEAEVAGKAKADRDNREINLERIRVEAAEKRKTLLESISTAGSVLGAGVQSFLANPGRIAAAAGGLSLLALGVYSAKFGTGVVARYIENRLGKPSLIRETSRLTLLEA